MILRTFRFLELKKKLMKKHLQEIKLATNWCIHWPQTDGDKNPMATNWRNDTACKKNVY